MSSIHLGRRHLFHIAGVFFLAAMFIGPAPCHAQANLTIEPLTWNVVGLDSNDVTTGPSHFPVGARVCNNGDVDAYNVVATFSWDDTADLFADDANPDPYINLRPGTNSQLSVPVLASAGACSDFYFEVQVTRDSNAYDNSRGYSIEAQADSVASVATPSPRQLFVERLISQSRNSTNDIKLDGVSIPPGGTMALVVGQPYTIQLLASTATNGYEQLESFINFPNTIFQVLSVSTSYSADTSSHVDNPSDLLYGDGCLWDSDPNSPNYNACLDNGKIGGTMTVTYQVKILQVPSAPLVNPEPLGDLIYDFSGSSFHYNADYGISTRYAAVVDPSTLTIDKDFSPDSTNPDGVSALTFTITNPNPAPISGISFSDTFPTSPGAMVVADPASASTSGCGSPSFAPTPGAGSISFSGGSVAAGGTCTVKVNVTAPVTGFYPNTSSNLFVDGVDTGSWASDSLDVTDAPPAPPCTGGLSMANWDMGTGAASTTPPNPSPSFTDARVTATAASLTGPSSQGLDNTEGNPVNAWYGTGNWPTDDTGFPATLTGPYFEFSATSDDFSEVAISFDYDLEGNWANAASNHLYIYSSHDSGAFVNIGTISSISKFSWHASPTFTASDTSAGTTTFRLYFTGLQSSTATAYVDNVSMTGCAVALAPSIEKNFVPDTVAVNGISTLTFTLTNPNSVQLTGVTFTDNLPAGVEVAGTPAASTTCGGTPTWAPTAGALALTFGSPTGATIPADASCTVQVDVEATDAGPHGNVSGFVSSNESGPNSREVATDTLVAVQPPVISKLFAPNPVLENGTSIITFTISNPNQDSALSGIAFSDTYPSGMVNPTPLVTADDCGGTVTASAGGSSLGYSGGTLAGGASCTVSVSVMVGAAGNYPNTTASVSHIINGVLENGNTASGTLVVNAAQPGVAILKQVASSATGPWSSFLAVSTGSPVYYRITVENTGDVPLNPVAVSDPNVDLTSCSWTQPLPVADVFDDDHITSCVIGPVTAGSALLLNTAEVTATYLGTDLVRDSSATYAPTGLTLDKTVQESDFDAVGDILHYDYLVTNSGSAPLLGPVTVVDNKTTVSCPEVSTVGDFDLYLDPGESLVCTATYEITASDVALGSVTNLATASISGVDSNQDSVVIGFVPVTLMNFTIE